METTDLTLISPAELFAAVSELLEQGYDAEFTVTGNSMWPLLRGGRDTVCLRKPKTPLKKGDIVLFSTGEESFFLHRIKALTADGFESLGDGNLSSDGVFSTDCVLGRVVSFQRKGKTFSCSDPWYRRSAAVWTALLPIRRPLLKLLRKIAKVHFKKK